jgi:putative CocE/NonD family hydrolase
MPMRDGAFLAADVFLPAAPGRYPVILERTPYLRARDRNVKAGHEWAARGYAFVKQDVRGRGDSAGTYTFLSNDTQDGFDSVEWLAGQDWSNGRVGMVGASYSAATAWLAARARPPHLVAIVPRAPCGRYFDELPYLGGAFMLEWAVRWISGISAPAPEGSAAPDLAQVHRHRPLLTVDEALGRPMPIYREFLTHPTMDSYWKKLYFSDDDFRGMKIPFLTFTGWFDADQPGAISYWQGMRKHSPAANQYLVIGPWTHGSRRTLKNGIYVEGDMELSADAVIDDKAIEVAFLNRFLKQTPEPFDEPRARIYVTGTNAWRQFAEYPPQEAVTRPLYLHSGGKANSASGDGRLDFALPGDEPADAFTYDPANPAPSTESNLAKDQRETETRDDVLVYSSAVLDAPVDVMGRVMVELHAATDARDTDFTAKLVDVYPDGRAVKLGAKTIGVIRARYREGYDKERLLTPNKTERYRIELFDVGHTFLPKHRIRLEISSSAFPGVAANPNTGHPVATDTESRVAHQRVHHRRGAASHIVLPVMPSRTN